MTIEEAVQYLEKQSDEIKKIATVDITFSTNILEQGWESTKRSKTPPNILPEQEAGKTIRIISSHLGKPDIEWLNEKNDRKKVVWNVNSAKRKKLAGSAAIDLMKNNIFDFASGKNETPYFYIYIDPEAYSSVFLSFCSDSWTTENQRKTNMRKINQVCRKLDR